MYLGPFHRAGSLSVADPDTEQPSTSGHPVDNRVDSLLRRIRPARHSELRRHRVAQHVSNLVARCFSADHEVKAVQFSKFICAQPGRSSEQWSNMFCAGRSLHVWVCTSENVLTRWGH